MRNNLFQNQRLARVLTACAAVLSATGLASASDIPTVRNGTWFPPPFFLEGGCFYPAAPGPADSVSIFHEVQLRQDYAPLGDISTLGLNLNPGAGFFVLASLFPGRYTLHTTATSTWSGGYYNCALNGGGIIQNDGVVNVVANTLSDRGYLLNTNVVNMNGANHLMDFGARIVNQSPVSPATDVASLRFLTDNNIDFSSGGGGAAPFIDNHGVIEKIGGTGLSVVSVVTNLFGNDPANSAGTVRASTGTLRFTSDWNNAGGHFGADAGAAVEVAGFFRLSTDPTQVYTYDGSGAGHLRLVAGGTFSGVKQTASGSGTFDGPGAHLNFTGDFFEWTGGLIQNGVTLNTGQINLTGSGSRTMQSVFDNAGIIVHKDTGTLGIMNNSAYRTSPTGEYNFTADGSIVQAGGGGSTPTFFNQGILRKSGGTGTSQVLTNVNNSGLIRVESGTLAFSSGSFVNTGSLYAKQNSTLSVATNVTVPPGQSVTGGGHFAIPQLTIQGTLSPGESPGSPTFSSLVLTSTSETIIELAGTAPGTQYDQVHVTGSAVVAGTLTLHLLNGFQPVAGQVFEFFEGPNVTGSFNFVSPTIDGQPIYGIDYSQPGAVSIVTLQSVPEVNGTMWGFAMAGLVLTRRRARCATE